MERVKYSIANFTSIGAGVILLETVVFGVPLISPPGSFFLMRRSETRRLLKPNCSKFCPRLYQSNHWACSLDVSRFRFPRILPRRRYSRLVTSGFSPWLSCNLALEKIFGLLNVTVLATTSLQRRQSFHQPVNRSVRIRPTVCAHLFLSFFMLRLSQ